MASKGSFLAEKLIGDPDKVEYVPVSELSQSNPSFGPTIEDVKNDRNYALFDAQSDWNETMDEISFFNDSMFGDGVPNMDAVSGGLQTFIICMYSLTALLSLAGNASVIVVLACGRKSSVRGYLINLAVSDITMAVFCIPFTYTSFMYNKWVFAPWFCSVATFMQHTAVTCSVYTLVIIGIDRYNALVHPLNSSWTKSRVPSTLAGVWGVSFCVASVQLVVTSAQRRSWGRHHYYQCAERWPATPDDVYEKSYTVAVLLVTFLLPLTSLAHSYISIVSMMCQHKLPGNADLARDRHRSASKAKAINMMLVVVVCFTLCWMPMHILMLLITFHKKGVRCTSATHCLPYYLSVFACHWVAMSNSFMNPFIYCFMSNNFREDLLQLVRRCRGRPLHHASLRSSDQGSSGRTALYIAHRNSFRQSQKHWTRRPCSSTELHHYGCQHFYEMTARQQMERTKLPGERYPACTYEHASTSTELDNQHQAKTPQSIVTIKGNREAFFLL